MAALTTFMLTGPRSIACAIRSARKTAGFRLLVLNIPLRPFDQRNRIILRHRLGPAELSPELGGRRRVGKASSDVVTFAFAVAAPVARLAGLQGDRIFGRVK